MNRLYIYKLLTASKLCRFKHIISVIISDLQALTSGNNNMLICNCVGAQGDVDESLALMAKVEEIKAQKKSLEEDYHSSIPRHAVQQQKLRACEVCGAFLSMYDNDRRLADHFGGKLHIGFVTIREKMKALEVN